MACLSPHMPGRVLKDVRRARRRFPSRKPGPQGCKSLALFSLPCRTPAPPHPQFTVVPSFSPDLGWYFCVECGEFLLH